MNETNETLADIVREMRDEMTGVNCISGDGDVATMHRTNAKLRALADRIEAAAAEQNAEIARLRYCLDERGKLLESAQAKMHKAQAASGNAAAMREALGNIRDLMLGLRAGDSVSSAHILSVVDRALAAPARNCDLYPTAEKATRAFQQMRNHRVRADACLWDDRDEIGTFIDWLFAPAQEGGER